MLVHADRHLPCVQRPHTRCYSTTRSLTHTSCLIHTHTTPLTHAGALTRGVSSTQGGSHTRAASRAHVVSSPCGAPFTHGVPGSPHAGTLVTTPLTHGGSFVLGVSSTHGGSSTHRGTLTLVAPRTQRLSPALCVRRSTHFATLVYTHRDTTHTGTTLHHTPGHSHWGQHSSPHTPGHSRRGFSPPQELPGSSYPPSSVRTRPQHSSPRLRAARPNSPGHDRLQGGILPPLVPEGG